MPVISDHIFAAKYVLGLIRTKDILAFADRKLSEGEYSDIYLDIIDAELKVWAELAPLLETALRDSGIDIPDVENATWTMLQYHISLIASGEVNPKEQFGYLLRDIGKFDLTKGINKYVGDNLGIEFMYGLFYDDYGSDAVINEGIKEECLKWLKCYSSKYF
jgi:hypothetical protein